MAIMGTVTSVTKAKKPELAAPQAAAAQVKPPLGFGGVDYNTSDAAMKQKIAQNQANIAGNDSHRQSEIQRALQVIAQRESQGLDTSAQNKYLTVNLGYKPPAASMPTAQASQAAAPSNTSQGSELMSLMRQIAMRDSTPFSYDPNNDPAYQAALKRASANIDQGNAAAQAEMNRRGILNSTITSDRMSEIAANEMGRVETDVLPSLMQQAYQQYLNKQAQEQQQFANMGNLAQMYFGEDQRGIDNQFATSDRTGYLNNVRTLAGQQLDMQQQGQQFEQQFAKDQFAYQQARDAITDQRWAQQFDEDVRRFGLEHALRELQENNQQAYRQAQIALSQADNARQSNNSGFNQLMDIWRASGAAPEGIPGVTAGTPYGGQTTTGMTAEKYATDYLDKMVRYDDDNQITNIQDVKAAILSSGLPDSEIAKLYVRYGIPLPSGYSGN